MTKSKVAAASEPSYPRIGTVFDEGRLQLVSVIGTGGYGVVYLATQTSGLEPSYAVKCLIRTDVRSPPHSHEIALHQLASSHPGVVTLHRIIEDDVYLYIVMDYAPDQDLFIQILYNCRYLGDNALIKSAFLQLLDAIGHCHSLGIYHRDLKPENIVCFDDGLRLALTDFGLATTQGISTEFRTGSVYHMSPECQMSDSDFEGIYSPQSCDIWSLGIVFLNIVTGRNPWKSASQEDAIFSSYRQNPYFFLPKILPISAELNEVLVMMLCLEWRARPTISQIRAAIHQVGTFYSTDAVFEGNVARCSWESGMDLGTGTHKPNVKVQIPRRPREPPGRKQHLVPELSGDEEGIFNENPSPLEDREESIYDIQYDSSSSPGTPVSRSNSSLCTLDTSSSPTTPDNADLSFDRHLASRPRYPFNSLISGLQHLFRLSSTSNSLRAEKDRLTPDPELFAIDI